jgi:hypothetical protein
MSITRHSAPGITSAQGPTIISGDPFSGYTNQTSFEGSEADMRNLAVSYANFGWTIKITIRTDAVSGENYASLEVSKPDDTFIPPVIWEVDNVRIDKHILDCIEVPLLQGLSTDTKHAIEDRVRKSNSPKPAAKSGEDPNKIEALISLMTTGTDAKRVLVRSIKRTQVLPYANAPVWATTYEDKIISRNTFIAAFSIPSWLQPFCPAGPVDGVQTDTKTGLTTQWGYLVDGVDGNPNGRNRMQWQQTFTFNNWSVYPYGIYEVA